MFSLAPFVSSVVETRYATVLDRARTEGWKVLALVLLGLSNPAFAQSVVVSDTPVSTSVTVYRDPARVKGGFDLRWLQGYALISEKRHIHLPAGDATVRFDGVADGMIAVSAVVTGLPGGVDEKNRDARLLSPASLLDGSLGNRVHLRRTNPATGKVTETDAVIRSGAEGAVVLETPQGVEALRCSGLPETLVYDGVPEGLSAKPAFSVQTHSPRETDAEVTLTYLATGFDWGASYVAKVAEDGKTLDLFAWLTVANGNGATYDRTQLLAVAGRPNRTSDFRQLAGAYESPRLNLKCWPMDSTSTHPGWGVPPPAPPMAEAFDMALPAPAMAAMRMEKAGEISVTAQARQEELGDLKLYRVPMPVDVVPNAQKQVALVQKARVPFTLFYRADASDTNDESLPLTRMIRMQNREKQGLGLPLPSGGIVVTQRQGDAELLLSDGDIADRAVGEKVEFAAGPSDQIRYALSDSEKGKRRLTLSNATADPAAVEIRLSDIGDDQVPVKASAKLVREDGRWLWKTTLPANGEAVLTYAVADR